MLDEPEPADPPQHVQMLKAIRIRHGWSQRQLAEYLMVSKRTIQNWEYGVTEPNTRDLIIFRSLLTGTQNLRF